MASSYRRRERAPKPLRVPLIAAALGFLIFLFGMAIASANTAGFGLLFVVWGVLSASFLVISRRLKKARAARGAGTRA
jgi:hypothetical protein